MSAIEHPSALRPKLAVPLLFTGTIFVSAALLFFVQPLFARLVLPVLGGAPAVWTTAMLFFQTVLIGGYLYAHLLTRHVPQRLQVAIHLSIWAAALLFLPLALPDGWEWSPEASTAWQTLTLFAIGVGLPFAVLSANAPLIQAWYARTDGPSSDDPYFLYGASNLGSLLALLAFPLIAEPFFAASDIATGFAVAFVVLGVGLLASGLSARGGAVAQVRTGSEAEAGRVPLTRLAGWAFLAFVPSTLMLSVTSKIATDIGALPLVWVLPLALYLLTFVLTFRDTPVVPLRWLRWGALIATAWLGLVFNGQIAEHVSLLHAGGLILAFFVVALFAHRRLYEARPGQGNLTLFYLVMSIGGALGGLFNSIIAPAIFDTLVEGMVSTLAAAALLVSARMMPSRRDAVLGVAVGLAGVAALAGLGRVIGVPTQQTWAMLALVVMAAALLRGRIGAFAIAGIAIVTIGKAQLPTDITFADRSFFGAHRVFDGPDYRVYVNGTTVHGAVRMADLDAARPEPQTYYHPEGPIAFAVAQAPDLGRIGIVGQGVGATACLARAGQDWHFYEIDPMVDRIARDPALFPFMSACTPDAPTYLGDARVVLSRQAEMVFDLLVIDAYSSNAVPMHLTSLEAVALYMERLSTEGVLLLHISNRYFAIERPMGRAAEALGLHARIIRHPGAQKTDPGHWGATVVAMARSEAALADYAEAGWAVLDSDGGAVWTDDRANLLSVLK